MNLPLKHFIAVSLMAISCSSMCQKISIDEKTLKVIFDNCKFEIGSLIDVEIIDDTSKSDYFTVEISGNQYVNNVTFPSGTVTITVSGSTIMHLLSLQVPDADKSEIKISRFNASNVKQEERTYTYRNSGGLKFDVSTGFFATGLKDQIYSLKDGKEPNTKTIVCEDTGSFRVGVGILAHIHSRWNSVINLGLSGGFELNNDSKIGYLTGGSLFFGLDRKFVFTGGCVLSKVRTISSVYKGISEVPESVNVVPVVEKWGAGFFAGLSYNF